MSEKPEWVSIGFVARPHGIRGELKVIGVDDGIGRVAGIRRVALDVPGRGRQEFVVERFRCHGREILLKLRGIESRNEAEDWREADVLVRTEELPALGEDEFYAFQLVGLEVRTVSGKLLGKVEEVQEFPANDVLVVRDERDEEILIPAVAAVVERVDLEKGVVLVRDMEGLTE